MKIGIYAGTFDPIHDGHLEVGRSSIEALGLNKLYFMVEPKPWGDKQPIPVEHRRQMVDIAIAKDETIERLEMNQQTFTIKETLPDITAATENAELFFIFGADVFMKMNPTTWPGLQELLDHYIVVFERNDVTQEQITNHAKELGIVVAVVSSKYPKHASTDVRMKPHETEVWVPKQVSEYIKEISR